MKPLRRLYRRAAAFADTNAFLIMLCLLVTCCVMGLIGRCAERSGW